MTDQPSKVPPKKVNWRRRAFWLGVALAILCRALPAEYHEACNAVASVCTGGM